MSPISVDRLLDVKGLSCPLPILRTKKMLGEMQSGHVLEVIATDPGAWDDFAYFCKHTGHQLVEANKGEAELRFLIRCR
ncbi:MAG: sulfurtransferase TusA family protein [Betaproteobacteria bacterium]|nr:sulfurtransferase TusA family protein [Betaproteobacteria bacterium]NBT75215.1 sulfurtransferase TusA family protein [Betaproteobacteria bacterium]NBY14176.1 sulfurtransferase TusA family protein [Betaproteobacteria bacterium]NCA16687.1 sulfurtransferase TusA family protein [Betaproteobacteria bacterium]NDF03512.1 sulfurtransferase TusA family protein [Betaproteobacteria bacterium]